MRGNHACPSTTLIKISSDTKRNTRAIKSGKRRRKGCAPRISPWDYPKQEYISTVVTRRQSIKKKITQFSIFFPERKRERAKERKN